METAEIERENLVDACVILEIIEERLKSLTIPDAGTQDMAGIIKTMVFPLVGGSTEKMEPINSKMQQLLKEAQTIYDAIVDLPNLIDSAKSHTLEIRKLIEEVVYGKGDKDKE